MKLTQAPLKNLLPATLLIFILSLQAASAFYDPGLQRWLNRDPIEERGDMNSSLYTAVANSPLRFVDPYGLTITVIGNQGDYNDACTYFSQDPGMKAVLEKLRTSRKDYTVRLNNNQTVRYDSSTRTIDWDPHAALLYLSGGRMSPALALAHEMAHASAPRLLMNLLQNIPCINQYDNLEELRVIKRRETPAARSLGEDTRNNHRGKFYGVPGPTCR